MKNHDLQSFEIYLKIGVVLLIKIRIDYKLILFTYLTCLIEEMVD